MPDGALVCGCDEQDGLLRVPVALEAVPAGGRFGMLPLQGLA